MEQGVFLLSLDTELALGHYNVFDPRMFSVDGLQERKAIARLLELFEKYEISVTWAIVGHFFSDGFDGHYPKDWTAKYPLFEQMYKSSHPLMHGADIVQVIKAANISHEIACHGFTHQKFCEDLMPVDTAKEEILAWKEVASTQGVQGNSIVFPNNCLGHLGLMQAEGFTSYRGHELMPAWFRLPVIGRLFRRLYYYLVEFAQPIVYEPELDQSSSLVNLPSSRWMFGLNRNLASLLDFLNLHKLRMRGIVKAVKQAARQNKVVHIWAHPYEFRTEKDFERLEYLLERVKDELDQGRMRSTTMEALASETIGQADA